MSKYAEELALGQRFAFGKNWQSFLSVLDEERIKEAEQSLLRMLEYDSLVGKRFLDIGSGSGLFSLAARRLGAKVCSFDYDPKSVGCTSELKRRYFPGDPDWTVEKGSILDIDYIKSIGHFDIVYSWGVLHHTGHMWSALENVKSLVNKDGLLFIAIYNDQGIMSKVWAVIKKQYCSGVLGKTIVSTMAFPYFTMKTVFVSIVKQQNPISYVARYKKKRGMSLYHDVKDWLGGYPFEVAKPEAIFEFYKASGFALKKLVTTNRNGCNQFVFQRDSLQR